MWITSETRQYYWQQCSSTNSDAVSLSPSESEPRGDFHSYAPCPVLASFRFSCSSFCKSYTYLSWFFTLRGPFVWVCLTFTAELPESNVVVRYLLRSCIWRISWLTISPWHRTMIKNHTSSKEFLIIYLIVVTGSVWPKRWARASAWSSKEGFHCGSSKCTLVVAVRSRLQRTLSWCSNVYVTY
jgi:hypothetical protein